MSTETTDAEMAQIEQYVAACLALDEQQFAERLQAEIARRPLPVSAPLPSARKPLPRFRVLFWRPPSHDRNAGQWRVQVWLAGHDFTGTSHYRPVAVLKALASPSVRAVKVLRWRYFHPESGLR